jgi:hypothetical protein
MDLTKSFPRSPVDRLGGMVQLKRMIDKARATKAGTQGEYIYNCPLDQALLTFLGIDDQSFLRALDTRTTDEEVLAWILESSANAKNPEAVRNFNRTFESRGPDSPEKWEYFRTTRDAIDPSRTDITTWVKLIDLEEKRSV